MESEVPRDSSYTELRSAKAIRYFKNTLELSVRMAAL